MRTLADIFEIMRALGKHEALRSYNGYRTQKLSYRDLLGRIGGCARHLEELGLRKGDRLILWGENRTEWVIVFWACVAGGIEVVPVDFHSSGQLVDRIQNEVRAKLLVFGDQVQPESLAIEGLALRGIARLPSLHPLKVFPLTENDVVEIVFTSGTTGEPKGVVHRHRNICANLTPIGHEINRFKMLARPFQPVRLLDLLPLSHMFGQSAGLMIPVLLGGAVVFTSEYHAVSILEAIRREEVSAVISVPRLLRNLQYEIERQFDLSARKPRRRGIAGVAERWWLYRDVHHMLGWKFWALIAGGAQLDAEQEDFWRNLGFAVVQGYGLTETSPIVAMNHPFSTRRGSIGKAIEGQEIRLAPDGEILVRGASVVKDYVGEGASETTVEDGWLHTGDIGEIDSEGRLYYKGRKKEMIVTADGLNVYPRDVEAELNRLPEVKESVVVARRERGEERVHAALILKDPGTDVGSLIRAANERLEVHQKIQSWSIWPEDEFPRTASTMKVKRGEVARRVSADQDGRPAVGAAAGSEEEGVRELVAQLTGRSAAEITPEARLSEDLGLSSLERVELLARIESKWDVELDEEKFSQEVTVHALEDWIRGAEEGLRPSPGDAALAPSAGTPLRHSAMAPSPSPRRAVASEVLPRWTRSWPIRWARRLLLDVAVLPAFRQMVRLRVSGLENLEGLAGPVIFAANHASHFDTPAVLAALPLRWRKKIAPAMSQDYFQRYFQSAGAPLGERLKLAGQYYLACGLFNAYPLPQQMAGTRRALRYTGELVDDGWYPLVYPEGERTRSGEMQSFKPGIGLMAVRLGVPVVPVHISGTYDVYSEHDDWPKPGNVRVQFGSPVTANDETDYGTVASRVEQAVRTLAEQIR
jgi:long-chain acyl-CoA synthetase